MNEPPNRYDVIITMDRGGGHLPDPAEFAVAAEQAASTRAACVVFDGQNWLARDIEISKNGHTLTTAGPSLAVFNGQLYMVYISAGGSEIWYNIFDGQNWREEDCEASREGSVKTRAGPSFCTYLARLYLVYRDDS